MSHLARREDGEDGMSCSIVEQGGHARSMKGKKRKKKKIGIYADEHYTLSIARII
jgi:hypothetical protein